MRACRECGACFDDTVTLCPSEASVLVHELDGSPLIDGKYRIERRLGSGGMGVVYCVWHLGVQREFALKLLRPDDRHQETFLARFKTEAAALGRLRHPAIVDVTDFGVDPRDGGLAYLVMEYLEGQTLRERCKPTEALPLEEALPILEAVAGALDHAHDTGVLHRDLKPANVFVCHNPGGPALKLLDFGLARQFAQPGPRLHAPGQTARDEEIPAVALARDAGPAAGLASAEEAASLEAEAQVYSVGIELGKDLPTLPFPSAGRPPHADERITRPGQVAGTLAYMAPEILRGEEASRSTDIYSFGVMAYELLVGRVPSPPLSSSWPPSFEGSSRDTLSAHVGHAPPAPSHSRPSLPSELDAPLLRALAEDPAERPGRATELVEALRSAIRRTQMREWREREPPGRLLASAVAVALLAPLSATIARTGGVQILESAAVDARFSLASPHPADPRLLVLLLDEASLATDATPLASRADEFAHVLEGVFEAGARAVAIDLLLPAPWSRSEAFARFTLRHAEKLTLAAAFSPEGEILGPECLSPLTVAALGSDRASALFGLANIEEDADRVLRRGRMFFMDRRVRPRLSWASRAAQTLAGQALEARAETFWLDQATGVRAIETVSWTGVPDQLRTNPRLFRGRLVLVGGSFTASGDEYAVPAGMGSASRVPGVLAQALTVQTILSGFPYRDSPPALAWGMLVLIPAAVVPVLLLVAGGRTVAGILVALLVAILAGSLVSFHAAGWIIPVVSALVAWALAAVVGLVLRRLLIPIPEGSTEEGRGT